jgi:hypothetical protein
MAGFRAIPANIPDFDVDRNEQPRTTINKKPRIYAGFDGYSEPE